jgi:hypothetical protein
LATGVRPGHLGLGNKTARLMRQQIGFLLQFVVLVFLPLLILWQLQFGFRLILMPALTLLGIVVFWVGYRLRES